MERSSGLKAISPEDGVRQDLEGERCKTEKVAVKEGRGSSGSGVERGAVLWFAGISVV